MIPIMLKSGRVVSCGPSQKKIYLRHCPTCDGERVMKAVVPLADHIGCPACGPTSDLWRLLDRSRS